LRTITLKGKRNRYSNLYSIEFKITEDINIHSINIVLDIWGVIHLFGVQLTKKHVQEIFYTNRNNGLAWREK